MKPTWRVLTLLIPTTQLHTIQYPMFQNTLQSEISKARIKPKASIEIMPLKKL